MPAQVCLATCYLPLDAENSRWWRRFRDELAHCGMDLILLSSGPAADSELRVIVVPFWLHGYAQSYAMSVAPVALEEPLAKALAKRDDAWTQPEHRDPAKSISGLGVCQQVMREILDKLQPAVVLVWGNSLPQSVVLQQLAVQQGRPCWVVERGLLPGTLMIEMSGQGGQSELNWSFSLTHALRAAHETDLFLAAQAAYRSRRESKYTQAEFLDEAAFRQKHNPLGRKLVAFLLGHDVASCSVPMEYLGARLHLPVFGSSEEAMLHLAAVGRDLDCMVLAKPHPRDLDDYSHCEGEHLRVIRDVNLFSLIEAADVVGAMTSTAQFEALLCEKPLLLLAHSPLADKGVAYEVKSHADLKTVLCAALNRDNFESRMARARQVLSFILRHFSIALTDSSSAQATLGELAGFLVQNALPAVDGPSVEARWNAVRDCFSRWEAAARVASEQNAQGTSQASPQPQTAPLNKSAGAHPDGQIENWEMLQQRGEALRAAAKWNEAAEIYQVLSRRRPDDLGICRGRLECARHQGHDVLADLVLEEALQRHPEWGAELNETGCVLHQEKVPQTKPAACVQPLPTGAVVNTLASSGSSISDVMKREWNLRAAEDARYYVRSATRNQSEVEFDTSGEQLVNQCVIGDLSLGTGDRMAKTMALLEIGCGVGRMTKHFARSFRHVHAIDVSGEMIRQARSRLGAIDNISLHETSGLDLALFPDGMFDLVFSYLVFQHIPDRTVIFKYMREAHRVLQPGGVFKFQVQGCTEKTWMEAPKVTWHGVTITEEDVYGLCDELGFDVLTKTGQDTQYAWYTLRKHIAMARHIQPTPRIESSEPLLRRAETLCKAANLEQASDIYHILTNRLPDDLAAWRGRLECARHQGHAVLADLILEEVLKRHPEWAAALNENDCEPLVCKPAPFPMHSEPPHQTAQQPPLSAAIASPKSCRSLDVAEIMRLGNQFALDLNGRKQTLAPRELWYPYGTMSNFIHLDRLLKGNHRRLLELIGELPVADIGAADGDLAFFLEHLGCQSVEIIDHAPTNYNGLKGAQLVKAALRSSVAIHDIDLDEYFDFVQPRYGLIFFLGILYHLQNPYHVLKRLAQRTRYCLISTRIARWTVDREIEFSRAPMAYLLDELEANNDSSNYWIFSEAGLRRILKRTKWEICEFMTVGDVVNSDPATTERDERAFCLVRSLLVS